MVALDLSQQVDESGARARASAEDGASVSGAGLVEFVGEWNGRQSNLRGWSGMGEARVYG